MKKIDPVATQYCGRAYAGPTIKTLIRQYSLAECRDIAAHVLSLPSVRAVKAYLNETTGLM